MDPHRSNGSVTLTGTRQGEAHWSHVFPQVRCLPASLPAYTCGSRAQSRAAHPQLPTAPHSSYSGARPAGGLPPFVRAQSPNEAQAAARPPRLRRNVKPPRSAENASELECARDDARASRRRRMTAAAREMSWLCPSK